MIASSKYIKGVHSREGRELFKLDDNIGTRINGYNLVMKTFRLHISFLTPDKRGYEKGFSQKQRRQRNWLVFR